MMDVLHSGLLNEKMPFIIRNLTVNELPDVLHLQCMVVAALEDKSKLVTLSAEAFSFILCGNGSLIGVFVDNDLIAFRATLAPELDDEHLGLDIGLDASELSSVIYQEISNVSPAFRGHGLQQVMAQVIMKQLKGSAFTYVLATVAPFNIPSLKDKFSQQMEVAALKEKYGGKLRYVFVKDLRVHLREYDAEQVVAMENITSQQELLAEGWRGTSMMENSGQWFVQYEK